MYRRSFRQKKETPLKGCLRNVLCKRSFAALGMTVYNYLLSAVATSTAQATVQPTIGLLPIPRNPIISTCAGTDEEPANCASECIRPMVSVTRASLKLTINRLMIQMPANQCFIKEKSLLVNKSKNCKSIKWQRDVRCQKICHFSRCKDNDSSLKFA